MEGERRVSEAAEAQSPKRKSRIGKIIVTAIVKTHGASHCDSLPNFLYRTDLAGTRLGWG